MLNQLIITELSNAVVATGALKLNRKLFTSRVITNRPANLDNVIGIATINSLTCSAHLKFTRISYYPLLSFSRYRLITEYNIMFFITRLQIGKLLKIVKEIVFM